MLVDPSGLNPLTERIIMCAFRVHSELGPGLLERPYKLALARELLAEGLAYQLDAPLKTTYKGDSLGNSYFMDVVVENTVIIEVKAVTLSHPVFRAQLVTYLRLTGLPVGLLMNFNVQRMRDGISRVLNNQPAPTRNEPEPKKEEEPY
jgi:GxxExxY protein